MKPHIGAMVFFASASAAHAAGWSSGQDRGIPFYNLDAGSVSITVACDHEGIYDPPQQYVQASVAGKPLDGKASLKGGGEEVTLPFESGTAFRQSMQSETWNKAMTIIGGPDAFILNGQSITKNDGPPQQFAQDCK